MVGCPVWAFYVWQSCISQGSYRPSGNLFSPWDSLECFTFFSLCPPMTTHLSSLNSVSPLLGTIPFHSIYSTPFSKGVYRKEEAMAQYSGWRQWRLLPMGPWLDTQHMVSTPTPLAGWEGIKAGCVTTTFLSPAPSPASTSFYGKGQRSVGQADGWRDGWQENEKWINWMLIECNEPWNQGSPSRDVRFTFV